MENDQEALPVSEASIETASVWSLTPRFGHAAMISGIRSLSHTHEQLIVGWTGDVQSPTGTDKVPVDTISQQERNNYESALRAFQPKEQDPDDERDQKTIYVPVWLEDKVAHGHYDGYCKQSP
jgi:trehalose 6-phosphate synthase/phosphatase